MEVFIDVCIYVVGITTNISLGCPLTGPKNKKGNNNNNKKRYSGISEYTWVPDLDFSYHPLLKRTRASWRVSAGVRNIQDEQLLMPESQEGPLPSLSPTKMRGYVRGAQEPSKRALSG